MTIGACHLDHRLGSDLVPGNLVFDDVRRRFAMVIGLRRVAKTVYLQLFWQGEQGLSSGSASCSNRFWVLKPWP